MKSKLLSLLLIHIVIISTAQQKFTISGIINDENNGEFLIGATVFISSTKTGTTTNQYGFYSLTVPKSDTVALVYSFMGYRAQVKKLCINKNYKINISLVPDNYNIDEVSVLSNRNALKNIEKAQMGVIDVPIEKIKSLPAILGEPDILKVIQLLPGVQSGNEGTTGYFVRGGNSDQNLVLLDEATVYNPNHLFGLFSTFNTRALNNAELIKGGFPAQYGGRLSSILDIKMKEGNQNEFEVQGGLGLISSQLTIEGPIKKQKATFIISGRRTYLDLLVRPFLPKGNKTRYHFYDLNGKINLKLSQNDRLFLSGFLGNDNAVYKELKGISYGILFENSAATLRWNHIFNQKLFSNTSLIYNTYLQNVSTVQDNHFAQTYSGVNDITGKIEFQYFPHTKHIIRFGGLLTEHRFLSMRHSETLPDNQEVPQVKVNNIPARFNREYAVFLNDEFIVNKTFSLNYGLRVPGFVSKEINYTSIEPRITIKIGIDTMSSVKLSYTMMNQYLHLIPSSTAALPTDVWIPSSQNTKAQNSSQYAFGYYRNSYDNKIEASIEVYYKEMKNQVLYNEGYQLAVLNNSDSGLVYGSGESYGAEFFLKKNHGRFSGWISYTLSWTNQQFDDLNFGESFPFKYDRRHVLSATALYALSDLWSFSAVFVYNSGGTYTLQTGRINAYNAGTIFEGSYFLYEGRNNTRLNAYHRLDLSASRKKQGIMFKREVESEWVFALYNSYSRLNPYFVYFYVDPNSNQPRAKQVSLLPIIPSITYNFKF